MLFYSKRLQQYITKVIMPKVLPIPGRFMYKGSFGRRTPYVTDIDTYSVIYPDIDATTIYPVLVDLVEKARKDPDLMLLYVRVGSDDRFIVTEETRDTDVSRIRKLLPKNQRAELDEVINRYKDDPVRAAFTVSRLVKDYKRIQWLPAEVLANRKDLAGGLEVTMTDILKQNAFLLIRYYVKIGSIPVGLDVVVFYNEGVGSPAYSKDITKQHIMQSNYENSFYYILFPIRAYFRHHNKKIFRQLNDLIDKQYGQYKQLMVKIGDYRELNESGYLDLPMASAIVRSIAADTTKILGPKTSIPSKLRQVNISSDPSSTKIRKWGLLLNVLDDDIRQELNLLLRDELYNYLLKLPQNLRSQYYFGYDELKKTYDSNS